MNCLKPGTFVMPLVEPVFAILCLELRIFKQLQRQAWLPRDRFEVRVHRLVAKFASAGGNQGLVLVIAPNQNSIAIGDSHGDEIHGPGRQA